ncbi:hypothetical protein QBC47DRAFT_433673 [Echria macrotheca]|uniref:Chitin deacetylase n=1 Tax=Echria macrotheca TaxID=438768 RepID=A0AAJ0B5P1_9PEZI|nr:hypothetical protein QBC47DRAFT_433673 [Echria macrotheca]
MRFSYALLTAASWAGLAAAHGDDHGEQHLPKLLGARRFLADMKMRRAAGVQLPPVGPAPQAPSRQPVKRSGPGPLRKRQDDDENTDGNCGPGIGSCSPGYCCSPEGWCGKGLDYCQAPDCQINYGSGCDGNQKPKGQDTSSIPRPKLGSVLYGGAGIYDCVKNGDIALTFDDGPYIYTNTLLDKLKSYGAKATFFITGNNLGKGMINDPSTIYPAIIRRMHAEGHQIASHTWSHQNASQLTNTQFTNQMVWNEIALNSILGFFPAYMRPPFSICERNCQNILSTLGYHAIYFDLDTAGYLNDSPKMIQNSKNIWDQAMRTSNPARDSFLQIEHDIHAQTVNNLTDYILTSLFQNGWRSVTVGECLGDPVDNWYRKGPDNSITVPTGKTPPGASSSAPPPRSTVTIRTTISRSSISTRSTIPFPTTTARGQPGTTIRTTVVQQPTPVDPGPGVGTRSTIPLRPTSTRGPSTDGLCGNGATCSGTRYGACCSAFGYCGTGSDFCSLDNGCQSAWGYCEGSLQPDSPYPKRM